MKTTLAKDQKIAFWQQHIEQANQYPDGIQKYCEAKGLASQTFYKWKLKLNSRIRKDKVKPAPSSPFAQVQVLSSAIVRKQALPDARWLAEFILQLTQAAQ